MKVHKSKIDSNTQEKYLGEVIYKSGKNKTNIEKRQSIGYGIISNILAIINEIPHSYWKIMARQRMRQARLLNGILCNSEAWHGISK